MKIHFTDKVDIRTNGRFVPSITCIKKDAPLILTRSGIRSDPVDCKRQMSLQRVKTHTTHIKSSGTDANLDMTFRVTKKVGNDHEIVRRCEKLRLNDRCTSNNCHEYGDIENYYVSDLGK